MEKMGYTQVQRDRRLSAMQIAFPEALVKFPNKLIQSFECPDLNDRHVLAAAVKGQANAIITNNTRDFPEKCLEEYGILCQTPDDFLVNQFWIDPSLVIEKLEQQTALIRETRADLIIKLAKQAPQFVALLK